MGNPGFQQMGIRISFFYAALFLVIGVMLPFLPVWLESRGLGPAQIGFVMAAGMWVRALSNPILAQFGDRFGRPDRLMILVAWAGLIAHLLFLPAYGFWPLLAASIPATMFLFALMPLGDAVTMLKVREGKVDYGKVRLWGSIAFIITASFSGLYLESRHPDSILWLVIIFILLVIISCHLLPQTESPGNKDFFAPIKAVLASKPVLIFMLGAALVQSSHAVLYGFATLHWRQAGISDAMIGALWAEGVIAEIILFAFSGTLVKRLQPAHFLIIAALSGIVRWIILAETSAIPALISVQLLHAFTFGATHLAGLHFIAKHIPANYAATAQSIYSSTAVGGAMALSTMFAGMLYENYGASAYYFMAAMCFTGVTAALWAWRMSRQ